MQSLADFERRFSNWIQELYADVFDRNKGGERWLRLARRRAEQGDREQARQLYRHAVRRNPDGLAARFELALLLETLGEDDAALLELRRVVERARRQDPAAPVPGLGDTMAGALVDRALEEMQGVDENVASSVQAAMGELATGARELAEQYEGAGFPRLALEVLQATGDLVGHDHALTSMDRRIRAESGVDIARWRKLLPAELSAFRGDTSGCTLEGEVLRWSFQPDEVVAGSFEYRILLLDVAVHGDFAVDVEVKSLQGDDGRHCRLMGLAFGARDAEDFWAVNFLPFATVDLVRDSAVQHKTSARTAPRKASEWVRVGVEVADGRLQVSQDGAVVISKPLTENPDGALGLLIGNGVAEFRNLRARTRR